MDRSTDEIDYLTASQEEQITVAQANARIDGEGTVR